MKKFKWTERQKRALRGSIKKWEKIVDGTGTDEGTENCKCCQVFDPPGAYFCHGCPIAEFTGKIYCTGTPYNDYSLNGESLKDAKRELAFIKKVYKAGGGT